MYQNAVRHAHIQPALARVLLQMVWSCTLCKKKQELLVKTGQWYHGGMAKPVQLDVDAHSDNSSTKTHDSTPPSSSSHERGGGGGGGGRGRFISDGHSSEKENMIQNRVGYDRAPPQQLRMSKNNGDIPRQGGPGGGGNSGQANRLCDNVNSRTPRDSSGLAIDAGGGGNRRHPGDRTSSAPPSSHDPRFSQSQYSPPDSTNSSLTSRDSSNKGLVNHVPAGAYLDSSQYNEPRHAGAAPSSRDYRHSREPDRSSQHARHPPSNDGRARDAHVRASNDRSRDPSSSRDDYRREDPYQR